jgi:hypothetical protein
MNAEQIIEYRNSRGGEQERLANENRHFLEQRIQAAKDSSPVEVDPERRFFITNCTSLLKASHLMMKDLLKAPESDLFDPISLLQSNYGAAAEYRHFGTPHLGEFSVLAQFTGNKVFYDKHTRLTISYLHPEEIYPLNTSGYLAEPIHGSSLDEGDNPYINRRFNFWLDRLKVSHETISAIAADAGRHVIPAVVDLVHN